MYVTHVSNIDIVLQGLAFLTSSQAPPSFQQIPLHRRTLQQSITVVSEGSRGLQVCLYHDWRLCRPILRVLTYHLIMGRTFITHKDLDSLDGVLGDYQDRFLARLAIATGCLMSLLG